jgi:hypothetical protein
MATLALRSTRHPLLSRVERDSSWVSIGSWSRDLPVMVMRTSTRRPVSGWRALVSTWPKREEKGAQALSIAVRCAGPCVAVWA